MIQKLKRYDVILVDFGPNAIGSEQSSIRPAVIIQNDDGNRFSNTTIVAPFTSKIKHFNQPTHTLIKKGREKGLDRDSMLMAECMRQVSEQRILKRLGRINNLEEQKRIKNIYMASFGE